MMRLYLLNIRFTEIGSQIIEVENELIYVSTIISTGNGKLSLKNIVCVYVVIFKGHHNVLF